MGSWAEILESIYEEGLELAKERKKKEELKKMITDSREPSKPNPWEKENEEAGKK